MDLDRSLEYLLDPITGSPSRNREVIGNVCLRVDDLFITGNKIFLDWFTTELKKHFKFGSLEWDDVVFCGQRVVRRGNVITVNQQVAIDDLHEALIPKGAKDESALDREYHTEYRSILGKLNWLQSRTQFHVSYSFSRLASASAHRLSRTSRNSTRRCERSS